MTLAALDLHIELVVLIPRDLGRAAISAMVRSVAKPHRATRHMIWKPCLPVICTRRKKPSRHSTQALKGRQVHEVLITPWRSLEIVIFSTIVVGLGVSVVWVSLN